MDKFVAMKTFVRIVEAGSLTAAAESLDTSLPTVVRTLAALERDLGVSLLKRTTRRLHLTDEGSQYLDRCRDILAATQEAEDILIARRTEPVGRLSVTASVLFGRHYLAPILYDFLRRNPKVSADVLFVDRVVNLIEEGMDVAVRIAHLRDSPLIAIPVGKVRRVVCASEEYLRRHGVPREPGDVRRHSCVRHGRMDARIKSMETMVDSMKAVKPATEKLYAVLTDEQKKVADQLIGTAAAQCDAGIRV
jgi:DNA-binding transcriptional LysR family regulator